MLFRGWTTKQPCVYSKNGNSIFTETESSISMSVPPKNSVLFLFSFPLKKFHFHFHFANFCLCFHISSPSEKMGSFHSIFIPTKHQTHGAKGKIYKLVSMETQQISKYSKLHGRTSTANELRFIMASCLVMNQFAMILGFHILIPWCSITNKLFMAIESS